MVITEIYYIEVLLCIKSIVVVFTKSNMLPVSIVSDASAASNGGK